MGHDGLRTAAYVDFWVKTLQDHPQEIYLASRDAQRISDYLIERGRMLEQVREKSVVGREQGGRQANTGLDLSVDWQHPKVEISRPTLLSPSWRERVAVRDRTMELNR